MAKKAVLGKKIKLHTFLSEYYLCDGDIVRIVYMNRTGEFNEIMKITGWTALNEIHDRLNVSYRFIACDSIDDVYVKYKDEDQTNPECRCFILLEESY